MKRFVHAALLAAAAALVALPAHAQNLLANPGFEDPLISTGSAVGAWFAFNGGGTTSATNSSAMPRTGAMHADLSIISANNNFAGVFQDVLGVSPGQVLDLNVWHKTPSSPLDLGVEVRIEWRNPANTAEVARTANLTPIPGGDYSLFTLTNVVPAGVGTARVVFAIQTFGPEPGNTGTVYLDDASLQVVPEPSAVGLAGVAGLAIVACRRRK